ncbi:MAG: guanylate kinase [Bdellovibrionales bacterium]|nr:guanylate kinase [Bdellovibrionales bacterium]
MSTPLIIVSAPSGAGKSSLCNKALQEFPELVDSVSFTTRAPREGETNGNPYFFVSQAEFEKRINEDYFAEWAKVHEFYYGTPRYQIEDAFRNGKHLIMDIDVQGANSLKAKYPDCHTIFVLPPSIEELRRRLEARDSGKTQNLEIRLKNAEKECNQADRFDYSLVNRDFDKAYADFRKIIEIILNKR